MTNISQEYTYFSTREPNEIPRKLYEMQEAGLRIILMNTVILESEYGASYFHVIIVSERDAPSPVAGNS